MVVLWIRLEDSTFDNWYNWNYFIKSITLSRYQSDQFKYLNVGPILPADRWSLDWLSRAYWNSLLRIFFWVQLLQKGHLRACFDRWEHLWWMCPYLWLLLFWCWILFRSLLAYALMFRFHFWDFGSLFQIIFCCFFPMLFVSFSICRPHFTANFIVSAAIQSYFSRWIFIKFLFLVMFSILNSLQYGSSITIENFLTS